MIKKIKKQIILFKIFFILLFLGKFLNPVLDNVGIPRKEKNTFKDIYICSKILYYFSSKKFYEIVEQVKNNE